MPPGVSPELSSSRVVSQVPAARNTARALTRWRAPVLRSTYSTPAARPALAITTFETIASVTIVSFPLAFAISRHDVVAWTLDPIVPPAPHGVALNQAIAGATFAGMSRTLQHQRAR